MSLFNLISHREIRILLFTAFTSIMLTVLCSACREPVQHNSIVGTWRLIEFADLDSTTNQWVYPYGQEPRGFFTYTPDNIVNLNISHERPLRLNSDQLDSTLFTYRDFMNNAVGYFGRYSIDVNQGLVTHIVEGGTIPFYIDTEQPRPFDLQGDTLTIGDGKTWRRTLVRTTQ